MTTNRRDDASQVAVAAASRKRPWPRWVAKPMIRARSSTRWPRPMTYSPDHSAAQGRQNRATWPSRYPAIFERSAKGWKNDSGYHRRSIAETQMSRYKQILGDTLRARTLPNQQTETRCLTDCSRWPNPSPIRLQKKRKPKNQEANTADPVSCNKATRLQKRCHINHTRNYGSAV